MLLLLLLVDAAGKLLREGALLRSCLGAPATLQQHAGWMGRCQLHPVCWSGEEQAGGCQRGVVAQAVSGTKGVCGSMRAVGQRELCGEGL